MGFWSTIFGTGEAVKSVASIAEQSTSGIIKGIDAAWYTTEEQVGDIKTMLLALQDQYTPRSLSRRFLAILLSGLFVVYALVALVFTCFGQTAIVENIIKVAEALSLGWIMMSIIIFYFGYYGMKQIFGKKGK